jgi:hypothetical protein
VDKDLRQELERINHKLSFYEWQIDYGGLDLDFKKVIKLEIEALKNRKSSLNAFRLS